MTVGVRRWGAGVVVSTAAALIALAVLAVLLTRSDDHAAGPSPADPDPAIAPARAGPSPWVPASQSPGVLVASTRAIDLGSTATTGSFGLANTGDLPTLYQVSSRTPWIAVEPIGGQLPGEGGRRVDVRVDRSAVGTGDVRGTVVVSWEGGSLVVHVRVTAGPTTAGAIG